MAFRCRARAVAIRSYRAASDRRRSHSTAHPAIVMLYLPGTNMNGEVALDDPRYSLPLYLAAHGVDVWAMDYRTHFVPPDTPPAKLAAMAGWTDRVFDGDIEAAAAFLRAQTHREKIFLAGLRCGANSGSPFRA